MSDFPLTLVLQFKTSKIIYGMANISIKSDKTTAFGGINFVLDTYVKDDNEKYGFIDMTGRLVISC